jgi:hypothetical protein
MNSIADMGGMHGHGPIVVEMDEPVFHAEWERRIFGILLLASAAGLLNADMFRYGQERMPPADYLASSYYEHWLHALLLSLDACGVLTEPEILIRIRELEARAN